MTKKPGRNRVEAWIYGVINPLEEALEGESLSGRRKDPSFRWRSGTLERLLWFRHYLTRSGSLILADLASYHPAIRETEKRHDALISELQLEAKHLFDRLVANQRFGAFVEQHFKKVSAPESMVNDVAEDLVNDDPEFVDPNQGSYRETWNATLEALKRFREESGYQALRSKLAELDEQGENTGAELVRLRAELVEEFDVPPAPIHA